MIEVEVTQGTEAWMDERRGRFTATRFKGLMSKKTTASYNDTIMDVVSEIITEETEEGFVSADMERGKDMEPYARACFEDLYDVSVREVGFVLPEDEELAKWAGISPDGVLPDGGLIEIKCPRLKTHLKYLQENRLPAEYKHQVQGQLLISDAPYCIFMSYHPKMKPFIVRVKPDKIFQKEMLAAIQDGIKTVKEKIEFYKTYSADEV